MTKTHAEKTSAENKSVGFDYQFYFFLWKVLELKDSGQTVGLEVEDDVHAQLEDGTQVLYQLKHTIQTKADGSSANLTDADIDLWKTLFNWIETITDKNANRATIPLQIEFVKSSKFVLTSNKCISNNTIIDGIRNFKIDDDINKLIKIIRDLKTDNEKLKKYVKTILSVDESVLSLFFKRVQFYLNKDNLIENCKQAIRAKMIPEAQVDRVYAEVESKIREENYHKIKNKEKIIISFDEFFKKYQRYFNISRDGSLPFIDDSNLFKLPKSLESQEFIKRLIEINEITEDDLEKILEFTTFKMRIENQILYWESEGYLVQKEIDEYRSNAITAWDNKFKKIFRVLKKNINANNNFSISQKLLDELREVELSILGQAIGIQRSNGEYYSLLDNEKIKLVSNQ